MFKKINRLPSYIGLENPVIQNTPIFTLKIGKNNILKNRFAFIATKKIDKRAVYRNKAKRRTRTYVELFSKRLKKGYDMIFFLKKEALSYPYQEIEKLIVNIFEKNKMIV